MDYIFVFFVNFLFLGQFFLLLLRIFSIILQKDSGEKYFMKSSTHVLFS